MEWFPHCFILVCKQMTEGQSQSSYATEKRGRTHGSSTTQFSFWLDTPHGYFKKKQKTLVEKTWKCSQSHFFPTALGQGEEIIS